MAFGSELGSSRISSSAGTATRPDVAVVVPAAGVYGNVPRLVAAGFASRFALDFEAVDDLQLAIEMTLRSVRIQGDRAIVSFDEEPERVVVTIGPVAQGSLEQRLRDGNDEESELRAFLAHLVDEVETTLEPIPAVVLRKRHPLSAT